MIIEFSNIYIDINFGEGNYSWLPKYITNNPSRFTTKDAIYHCHWLGFGFTLVKQNYCDLIHIELDTQYNCHTNNVLRFIGVLKKIVYNPNHPFWDSKPKFKVNYNNGKFYVTGERRWFLERNLGSLLQYRYPETYMSDEEMKLFPEY